MKPAVLLIFSISLAVCSFGQTKTQKISDVLAQFIGEWKGEGWHYHSPDKTNYFDQSCLITPKLNGQVLLVEQTASLKESPYTVLFSEISIWRYDDETRTIIAETFRGNKKSKAEVLHYENFKLKQSKKDTGEIFTTAITEKQEYVMIGERIESGGKSTVFFRMKLRKQE